MGVADKATGEISFKDITLSKDEGPRPETSAEGLAGLKPVRGEGFTITAGNAGGTLIADNGAAGPPLGAAGTVVHNYALTAPSASAAASASGPADAPSPPPQGGPTPASPAPNSSPPTAAH